MKTSISAVNSFIRITNSALINGYEKINLKSGETINGLIDEYRRIEFNIRLMLYLFLTIILSSVAIQIIMAVLHATTQTITALWIIVGIVITCVYVFPRRIYISWNIRTSQIDGIFDDLFESMKGLDIGHAFDYDSTRYRLSILAAFVLQAEEGFTELKNNASNSNIDLDELKRRINWIIDTRQSLQEALTRAGKFGMEFKKQELYKLADIHVKRWSKK